MPDLVSQLMPELETYRLPGFDLGGDFLYPNYNGRSILNLPTTIAQLLGAGPIGGAVPLDPKIREALGAEPGSDIRHVILVLVDALSLYNLQKWLDLGDLPGWSTLIDRGALAALTSTVPSTTSAALSTLWSGLSPAEHGIAGYELWLKEYGMVANMIQHAPFQFASNGFTSGSLAYTGFKPEEFIPAITLGSHLNMHGIKSYAFQQHGIAHSGLSRMLFSDVEVIAFGTSTDLWINLRTMLEKRASERVFAWVYWGEVDHFSHIFGPDDERVYAEFRSLGITLRDLLLSQLSPQAREGTLLLVVADHGQIHTPSNPYYDLRAHKNLIRRLHIDPTGENRLAYFFPKPSQLEAVREYIERTWPRRFELVDSAYAASSGLFGPGEPHPALLDRLGDLMAIARDNSYLWWGKNDNHLQGRHGGLSPQEMLVPLIATRLDRLQAP